MPLKANDIAGIAQALKDLGAPAQQGINAVSLKLPDFWTDKPEVWFARVEAKFGTKNIRRGSTSHPHGPSCGKQVQCPQGASPCGVW